MIYLVIFVVVTVGCYILLNKSSAPKPPTSRKITLTREKIDRESVETLAETPVEDGFLFRTPSPPVTMGPISLSRSDDEFGDLESSIVLHSNSMLSGHVIHFEYVNLKHEYSSRRVQVSWVGKRGRWYYLSGYCYERRAHRIFRMDRMGFTGIIGTEEIFDSGSEWLKSVDPVVNGVKGVISNDAIDGWQAAAVRDDPIKYFSPGSTVLMYLSRFDGKMMQEERNLIATFITAVQPDIDSAVLARFVRGVLCWFPSEYGAAGAFSALACRPSEIRESFHSTCQRLFSVSGPVSEAKRAEWKRFEGRLAEIIG